MQIYDFRSIDVATIWAKIHPHLLINLFCAEKRKKILTLVFVKQKPHPQWQITISKRRWRIIAPPQHEHQRQSPRSTNLSPATAVIVATTTPSACVRTNCAALLVCVVEYPQLAISRCCVSALY